MSERQHLLLTVLREGPETLRPLAQSFPAGWLEWRLREGEWSALKHLHHLRTSEARYLKRLEGVLRLQALWMLRQYRGLTPDALARIRRSG